MVLFILHKLILQTHMHSHPVGLGVSYLVGPFVYFHTSCVRTAKALARLCRCTGSPEPSLVAYGISTIISWAGSFNFYMKATYLTVLWYPVAMWSFWEQTVDELLLSCASPELWEASHRDEMYFSVRDGSIIQNTVFCLFIFLHWAFHKRKTCSYF